MEELMTKLRELELRLEGLKENVTIFQENINNNITWFYMLLTIIVAILLASLYFLVKQAVNSGIKKGITDADANLLSIIQNEKQLKYATGDAGALGSGEFIINGLVNFSPDKFVSLLVYKKVSGEIIPYQITKIIDGTLYVKVDGQNLKDLDDEGNLISDGMIYWALVWRKENN